MKLTPEQQAENPCPDIANDVFRRKPAPSLVPWTRDDVPLDHWFRKKYEYEGYWAPLSGAAIVCVCWAGERWTYEHLLVSFEHRPASGGDWQPCGKTA